MKAMIDVQQLLKKFGIIIYTGDRLSDLELMEIEIDELYQYSLISPNEYKLAKLVLKKEMRAMHK